MVRAFEELRDIMRFNRQVAREESELPGDGDYTCPLCGWPLEETDKGWHCRFDGYNKVM